MFKKQGPKIKTPEVPSESEPKKVLVELVKTLRSVAVTGDIKEFNKSSFVNSEGKKIDYFLLSRPWYKRVLWALQSLIKIKK